MLIMHSYNNAYTNRAGLVGLPRCGFLLSPADKAGVIKLTFTEETSWGACDVRDEMQRKKCPEYIAL